MDRVDTTIHDVIAEYAKPGLKSSSYITYSRNQDVIVIVDQSVQNGQNYTDVALIVHFVDHYVVIEYDASSDPLYEALMQAGIPREQIILAYAGETIPETPQNP